MLQASRSPGVPTTWAASIGPGAREDSGPQAYRHGQVQRGVAMLSPGISIGPIGQQRHNAVKAVAHHGHMQGCVSHGAGAVHVAALFQQHAGHLWGAGSRPESAGHSEHLATATSPLRGLQAGDLRKALATKRTQAAGPCSGGGSHTISTLETTGQEPKMCRLS